MPAASKTLVLVVATLSTLAIMIVSACGGHPQRQSTQPATRVVTDRPASNSSHTTAQPKPAQPKPAAIGIAGRFRVGERQLTFTEPAHTGPTGQYLGERTLVTEIRYPLAPSSSSQPASGPFPLLVFGPGFMLCSGSYAHLQQTWASAGYVVAGVDFPRTNCRLGYGAYEPDLVNQPADMYYVITSVLALSAQPHGLLAGLVNRHEIGAAGQSDGGDTVAALAANTCCSDHRLAAVAVLSGAEWGPMPGPYFAHGAPPMLFVQGSADTNNPPWTSVQLYQGDERGTRYYLDLFGADHLEPYLAPNAVERVVSRVTLAFFDRYVLGQAAAQATMTRDGNVRDAAELVTGDEPAP